ncbi:hypothetical protein F5Y03DRAFT_383948 [Xylaria venustula]|nr:hypothetical protein F5Y03DRAFT_383948 [Xylaria venustula]
MTIPAQAPSTMGHEGSHEGEVSADTVRDSVTSPVASTDESPAPPPLPQRPTSTHPQSLPQPLPQPFYSHNQPVYVPYTGQPDQPFPYATPVRPLPHHSSAYLAARIGLTVLSSVWGIIILALTSILLYSGGVASVVSLYAYVIVAISILWNTAELITYCVRLRKQVQRGIHPGAHVGLHLLFWLAGALASVSTIAVYVVLQSELGECKNSDSNDDDSYSYYNDCSEFEPLDYYKSDVIPTFRALVAIFILWTINHFILFVLACIETHKRNAMRPVALVMRSPGPAQGVSHLPQAGAQPMQPVQYYPYPVMMQPQTAHGVGNGSQTQSSNEKQPTQPYQNIAGFYAPGSGPSTGPSSNNAGTSSPA